jgi:hypothetical protein
VDKLLPYCWKQGAAVAIDATGTAGGLAILWNTNSILLENFLATRGSITTDYRLIGSNQPGHLTNVYGPATIGDKASFLRNLEFLASLHQHNKWIIGGDFNLIRNLDEKRGGSRRLEQETSNFNSFIDTHNLIDLETINGIHTWTNRRSGTHQIACKLDRSHLGIPHDGRPRHGSLNYGHPRIGPLAHSALDRPPNGSRKETFQI